MRSLILLLAVGCALIGCSSAESDSKTGEINPSTLTPPEKPKIEKGITPGAGGGGGGAGTPMPAGEPPASKGE
ncbi:MAG: hypothetical protein WCK51_11660 [Armatimonadota bacterium]